MSQSSISPQVSPTSLFERRGVQAPIKLRIPKNANSTAAAAAVKALSSCLSGEKSSASAAVGPSVELDNFNIVSAPAPPPLQTATTTDSDFVLRDYMYSNSNSTRRGSVTSLHSAKYSVNSLLEDADPRDRNTLEKLFVLMDRLSLEIQFDLNR